MHDTEAEPVAWLTARERLVEHRANRTRAILLRAAWAASIAAIVLLVIGGYAWRAEVMSAWPPSTRLYAMFGLATAPH
jgi:hypothetical protein